MRNFLQAGSNLSIPAQAILAAGDVVLAGDIIGIAAGDAAIGAIVDVATTGIFTLAKTSTDTFAVGAKAYWVVATKKITSTSASNTHIGTVTEAAGNGAATAKVRIKAF